jgi:CheY-like chemotaxis protein
MESMGGSITARSSVGAGSRFTVDLAAAEGPLEHARRLTIEPPARAGKGNRSLVYIEDNLSNLKLVEYILGSRPDVTLHAAMQGRIGLDIIREHHPDLVLLDLDLPDVPGLEVLHLLQEDPQTRSIPVVVISADATAGQIERLLAAGAAGYLTKPLDVKEFLHVLDHSLSESESA